MDDAPAPLPIIGHAKTVADIVKDATWIALGQPKPHRVYISTQGDFWDLIALQAYGRKRGNEHLMFRLLEANYPLRDLCQFPAGVSVIVPEVDVATEIPLVPWKSATRIPSP